MIRAAGVLLATAVVSAAALVVGATAATAAITPTGSTPSATGSCANPLLAQNTTGWSVRSGGSGRRVAITGHAAAAYAYRVTTSSTAPVLRTPAQAVTAGQSWTFAADSLISSGGKVRLGVDWYDASSGKLAHVDGAPTAVGPTSWVRVPLVATAPAGAVRAALTETAQLTKGALWSSTACDYVAGSTPPPPPPAGDDNGTQAAAAFGWGAPTDGDEFDSTAVDPAKWYLYDSKGHDGNGLRKRSQIAVANGVLTMSGTSNGTTGGMAAATGHRYGRWETRMRVPAGDDRYHPVLLAWPDAEDWPVGGEIDYAETSAASTDVEFFLHYGSKNNQTSASRALDLTQWHDYAVEWTPGGIRGFVDGVQFFSDTNTSHLPPRTMHETIQLDWFPGGSSATTPSSLVVAWTRYYPV